MLNEKMSTMTLGAAILALVSTDAVFAQPYYGSRLITPQERAEHRAVMRSLPPSEREAYRAQQHEAMKKRAESMGLSLPDQPSTYGRNVGRGGPGYGYGRGGPPGYWGPGYGGWRDRGGYEPGFGD
jgi:hypothetical protein